MKTLSDIGELSIIKQLCSTLQLNKDVITGPGDDCAVVRMPDSEKYDILLTSDPVIENIHFTAETEASHIGHKSVGRVLSDIAAMGGDPLWCLMNIAAPKNTPEIRIKAIFEGASALAEKNNVSITGGDIAEAATLSINAFCAGKVIHDSAILRSGAKAGDAIFVTGSLGGSIKGKHLTFTPRIPEGQYLVDKASSAIDVTDGLATDLRRIIEASNTGAKLFLDNIPLSDAAINSADKASALEHALSDGEDFELLFTLPQSEKENIISEWNSNDLTHCSEIGVITTNCGTIESSSSDASIDFSKLNGYLHFE